MNMSDQMEIFTDGMEALPRFTHSFRERTVQGWESFLAGEAELRTMIQERRDGDKLIERCRELLAPAFADVCFELGFNGEKTELILTPEGDRAKLFQLVYFERHAPEKVREYWNVSIGRQPSPGFGLRMFGQDISAEDVRIWIQKPEDGRVVLLCYCEKLLPILQEDEGQAYWLFSILLDQTIGELAAMELVEGMELLEAPVEGNPVTMNRLRASFSELGLEPSEEPGQSLEQYTAYELEPNQDGDADLRLDVFAGMTLCLPLLEEYYHNENGLMDYFHQDGAVPGFFYYPLDSFADAEERGKAVLDFRDRVENSVLKQAGDDVVTFIGGASGINYGYLDFIAWDLETVLDAAVGVFAKAPVAWAAFHTFRRDAGGVTLKDDEQEGTAE